MFRIWRIAVAVVILLSCQASLALAAEDRETLTLTVDLVDGTHVSGTTPTVTIPVQTPYGKLMIPLKATRTVHVAAGGKSATFALRNGDRITAAPLLESLVVQTPYGEMKIPPSRLKTVTVWGATPTVTSGLTLYYPFDGDAEDQAPRERHGTIRSGRFVPDRSDRANCALALNGTSTSVTARNSTGLGTGRAMTVAMWFKAGERPKRKTNDILAAKYRWFNGQGSWLVRLIGDQVFFHVSTTHTKCASTGAATSETRVKPGRWTHVAAVFDNGKMRLYINGELDGEGRATGPTIAPAPTTPVQLGWAAAGSGKHYFKGAVDDFVLYNRALTAKEVARLYGG